MAGSDARTFIDLAMLSNTSRGCSLMRASKTSHGDIIQPIADA